MIIAQKKHQFRNTNDKYITPYSLIQQLLDKINLDKTNKILEPCASIENCIGNTLTKNGYNVTCNIFNEDCPETNFLSFDEATKYDIIFTNSPYGDKTIIEFVNKMKKIATKQIICLYPLSILHGTNKHNNLWNDKEFGLKYVYVFVRPPWLTDFVKDDGTYATGINQYAWFIWEKDYTLKPQLDFIDNSKFVIGRKKYFNQN